MRRRRPIPKTIRPKPDPSIQPLAATPSPVVLPVVTSARSDRLAALKTPSPDPEGVLPDRVSPSVSPTPTISFPQFGRSLASPALRAGLSPLAFGPAGARRLGGSQRNPW